MKRPLVSIVIPTHNRSHLFMRSLVCYSNQEFKDFEIIVLDDHSNDGMEQCCRCVAPELGLDLKHFWFRKEKPGFRDGACQINYGIRSAAGRLIITTSPEVMPGKTTLAEMVLHYERFGWGLTDWLSAKAYLLGPEHQQAIDTVDWNHLGAPAAVRLLPDFYKAPSAEYNGMKDFLPAEVDKSPFFGAAIFCGMTRQGWRMMGGYPESETWGSPDPSFMAERNRLGIKSYSLLTPESVVVHQWHDGPQDVKSPRDMNKCIANLITGPWDNIRW